MEKRAGVTASVARVTMVVAGVTGSEGNGIPGRGGPGARTGTGARGGSDARLTFSSPAARYCGGYTANASTSTSQSALTSASTPTVDRAGFTGFVAVLKN